MMIHEVTPKVGKYKARKRIGRGESSGHGKTSGRGHKGAGSRSGWRAKAAFEGGQMPYFRRIPKRGFNNANFTTEFWIVNLCDIVAHPEFRKGGEVTAERLVAAGLIRDTKRPLKVLGDLGKDGRLGVALKITADRVTESVRRAVTEAGGSIQEKGTRRDRVRGIDRNSDDRAPKNLTKKLHRGGKKKGKSEKTEEAAAE